MSIATPPGWDAGPDQVLTGTHLLLGGERHCRRGVTVLVSNQDFSIQNPTHKQFGHRAKLLFISN